MFICYIPATFQKFFLMLVAYFQNDNKSVERKKIKINDNLPKNTIWIDLIKPRKEEERYIEKILSIEAPTEAEMEKFEVISPFYVAKGVNYMTITVLDKACEDYPDSIAITFILTGKYLITTRYDNPKSFDYINLWLIRNKNEVCTHNSILMKIVECIVDCSAEILEKVGNEIDTLLKVVFEKPVDRKKNDYYNDIIRQVGFTGNIISKNREALVSLNRMITFFSQIDNVNYISRKGSRLTINRISREITSLSEYANFLVQRNSFLLDATLGMISVEQNMIIKIFTVAAAVFMPPTVIASIYGMNFAEMPMLHWPWPYGYYASILLIIVSALAPYVYFKRKGLF